MKKFLSLLVIALLAVAVTRAQTRRGGAGSGPRTTAPATTSQSARPTPTPAASATRPAATTPAKTGADEDCGCEDKPLPDVLAVVNGTKLTRQDLTPEVQAQVKTLEQQVVEARKNELDLEVNTMLLEAEAKKRGMSTGQLMQAEVFSKTPEPTDAEAQAFYNQNRERIQGEFAAVRNDIIAYLRDQRQQELSKAYADRLRAAAQVKIISQDVTPPTTDAERRRVLATVNGKNITAGDVESALRPLVFDTQEQIYALRRHDIDVKINDLLLQQEAQKRGVTPQALLQSEIDAKLPTVTDAQARAFYDQNKARINGDFAQVKDQIVQYLRESEAQKLSAAFAQRLRNGASIQTYLVPPEPPVLNIATDDQPMRGNPNATVTLVEFTDFQCPSCAAEHPILERLMNEYGDRVKFVIRDFPLAQHANARKAAEAAEAARAQGKYWEYADLLFRNQSALEVDKLKQYASGLGLDRAKFDAALDRGTYAEEVERDMIDGQRLGVNATPTLYVNGRRLSDRTYEGVKAALDAALKGATAAKPTASR